MRRLQTGRRFPVSILIGDLDNLKEVNFNQHHNLLPIRISLGVATGEQGTPLEIVLHEADRRMYAASAPGKRN